MKLALDYDDVLVVPKFGSTHYSSRSQAQLRTNIYFKNHKALYDVVPIMSTNMTSVTTLETVKVLWKYDYISILPKYTNLEDVSDLYYSKQFVSIGLDASIIPNLFKYSYKFIGILIDVANGYMRDFQRFCHEIVKSFPDKIIIAGNVCTYEGALALAETGVDAVRVGIGGGGFCMTREVTGIGMPMVSCIQECADIDKLGVKLIADGGIKNPGDIVKSFSLGSDFVCIGSMFAGHIENSEFNLEGKIIAYGMSSSLANEKYAGGMKRYKSSEGRIVELEYRGPLSDTIEYISGGLRSAMTYCGAETLHNLQDCVRVIQVNQQLSKQYENSTIGT